ncbi:MAG: TIGR01777 family protein [Gemmatimonadetes bacterium]|nr:TIGR01777 family protein [Gemmatimonadota bacterium]
MVEPVRLTVAITGATGMLGSALASHLASGGHAVRRIGRAAPAPGSGDIQWDPVRGLLDPRALEGVDAVVHLAGASVADRWTAAHRRAIVESRVRGTALLARTLAQLDRRPRVLASGSAIGIYGERGSDELDETAPVGRTWLAEVAAQWELAADPARAAGIRVVHPRTGIVLAAAGGVLGRLLPIFRAGGGGKVGSGAHWVSWIALDDVVRGLEWMLQRDDVAGPVNLTAPAPVTNAEFTKVLGEVLRRPAVATVPAFALKLVFGEAMTREVLMGSQRALPRVLRAKGFVFRHATLADALRFELGV